MKICLSSGTLFTKENPLPHELKTPSGKRFIPDAGEPVHELILANDEIRVDHSSEEKVPYQCGHEDWAKFSISLWGEQFTLNRPTSAPPAKAWRPSSKKRLKKWAREQTLADKVNRELCSSCVIEFVHQIAIRCARCGYVIMPGMDVTLYLDEGQFNEAWCTFGPDGTSVVGCTRPTCIPHPLYHAGKWLDGFESAYGGSLCRIDTIPPNVN